MGKKFKIVKTEISRNNNQIKPTSIIDEKICFNFKYLDDCNTEKFNYKNKDVNYFNALISRLKSFCMMTRKELHITCRNSESLRCHPIKFGENGSLTEKNFGIPGTKLIRTDGKDLEEEAYQLTLSEHEHGRIHGFFIGSIFYIRWLDSEHELDCGK